MTFEEILRMVQEGEKLPTVCSDHVAAAYKALVLIKLCTGYLDEEKRAGRLTGGEYTGRRKNLNDVFNWFRDFYGRQELQDRARTENAKRKLSVGLLGTQARKEGNELAIRICDIIDGIRPALETEQEASHD